LAEQGSLYVAREEDLAALQSHWDQALTGTPRFVRLQAPFGGGRRALVGELLRGITGGTEDAILWRVTCLDQENGLQWLVRMYGSLMATLNTDILRKGKVEMVLNASLPNQPKRVQAWYQSFVSSLKESKTDAEKGAVQLKLPQDNPLIALIEVTSAVARKVPILLEIQNPHVAYSLALAQFLEALYNEAAESGARLLVVLHDEAPSEVNDAVWPMPLLDLFERRGEDMFHTVTIDPWGVNEVQRYLDSKELKGDAARLAEIAGGRPGFVAELTDILTGQGLLAGDLGEVSFSSLVPTEVDESELDIPEAPPKEGERRHAGPNDLGQVAYFAALLGQAFPSGLVADMGGYDRDSVDDLIDAVDDLFEEVQFAEDLGTWIYKFARGSWREGILEQNDTDEGHELARRVGLFMERFLVPRGYGFIVKTARVYGEHGAADRARVMRSLALSNDHADVWGLSYDLVNYFDENEWPEVMVRTVYMNLLDRLVTAGPIQTAERVHEEVQRFADERDDRELVAWLRYAGSRLDARRQDFYRARDRASQAIELYTALDNRVRVADIHNHLAAIELQDGKSEAALEQVQKALDMGQQEAPDGTKFVPPGIFAHAAHIRGLVARRAGKLPEAAEQFRRANEVAGQAGLGALALDAGLAYGESLLASRDMEKARDVLQRVRQIAAGMNNPARERSASELLAQAEGALRNYDEALKLAERTLQLSQQLQFEQVLPIDLYNIGFFNFVKDQHAEALKYFDQAESRVGSLGNHPVVKELYYFKGIAHLRLGHLDKAKDALQTGLEPAEKANDLAKMISALDMLAGIEEKQGHTEAARVLLNDALDRAQKANMKDARKTIRKRLDSLR
jgi:tetratricopeptide (TPR) repeat protein